MYEIVQIHQLYCFIYFIKNFDFQKTQFVRES